MAAAPAQNCCVRYQRPSRVLHLALLLAPLSKALPEGAEEIWQSTPSNRARRLLTGLRYGDCLVDVSGVFYTDYTHVELAQMTNCSLYLDPPGSIVGMVMGKKVHIGGEEGTIYGDMLHSQEIVFSNGAVWVKTAHGRAAGGAWPWATSTTTSMTTSTTKAMTTNALAKPAPAISEVPMFQKTTFSFKAADGSHVTLARGSPRDGTFVYVEGEGMIGLLAGFNETSRTYHVKTSLQPDRFGTVPNQSVKGLLAFLPTPHGEGNFKQKERVTENGKEKGKEKSNKKAKDNQREKQKDKAKELEGSARPVPATPKAPTLQKKTFSFNSAEGNHVTLARASPRDKIFVYVVGNGMIGVLSGFNEATRAYHVKTSLRPYRLGIVPKQSVQGLLAFLPMLLVKGHSKEKEKEKEEEKEKEKEKEMEEEKEEENEKEKEKETEKEKIIEKEKQKLKEKKNQKQKEKEKENRKEKGSNKDNENKKELEELTALAKPVSAIPRAPMFVKHTFGFESAEGNHVTLARGSPADKIFVYVAGNGMIGLLAGFNKTSKTYHVKTSLRPYQLGIVPKQSVEGLLAFLRAPYGKDKSNEMEKEKEKENIKDKQNDRQKEDQKQKEKEKEVAKDNNKEKEVSLKTVHGQEGPEIIDKDLPANRRVADGGLPAFGSRLISLVGTIGALAAIVGTILLVRRKSRLYAQAPQRQHMSSLDIVSDDLQDVSCDDVFEDVPGEDLGGLQVWPDRCDWHVPVHRASARNVFVVPAPDDDFGDLQELGWWRCLSVDPRLGIGISTRLVADQLNEAEAF